MWQTSSKPVVHAFVVPTPVENRDGWGSLTRGGAPVGQPFLNLANHREASPGGHFSPPGSLFCRGQMTTLAADISALACNLPIANHLKVCLKKGHFYTMFQLEH